MKKPFTLLLLTIIIFSCSNSNNPAIKTIEINGDPVNLISYNEIQDSVQISLSQLASELHFVKLETTEECMIGYGQYYIYDKYILNIHPFEKIMQFTAEGKFVRQVCRSGKGPHEFQHAVIAVDEVNDFLYVADEVKSYFMSWDLNTGKYLGDIPIPFKGRLKNLLVTKDGTLLVAPVVGHFPSGDYYLWEQDLEGNLIREIKAPHQDFYRDSQSPLLHFNGSGYN
ncbi:MAG: 6-bladed beta-propeller, partial [Bacteroidales bacterium]|nr:6-bladed beta-propeller [Bacteroidales bacterium]